MANLETDSKQATAPHNSAQLTVPQWKVFFNKGFGKYPGARKEGEELVFNHRFFWNGQLCVIPAVYVCTEGLVLDFCMQVSAEHIRSFLTKWNLSEESDEEQFTEEEQMQIEAENPLNISVSPKAVLNGIAFEEYSGCGFSWNPCFAEGNGSEAKGVIDHYGLDPAFGWVISRTAFPWGEKKKPAIESLSITLSHDSVAISGPRFQVSAPGEKVELIHPVTGVTHTLTVQEYEPEEIPQDHFDCPTMEFPTHCAAMSYQLSPDLPEDACMVMDSVGSDMPRQKQNDSGEPQESDFASIGIIGCSDGPTAILVGGFSQGKLHSACSALRFEPADHVKWRIVFYEKPCEDITVMLR